MKLLFAYILGLLTFPFLIGVIFAYGMGRRKLSPVHILESEADFTGIVGKLWKKKKGTLFLVEKNLRYESRIRKKEYKNQSHSLEVEVKFNNKTRVQYHKVKDLLSDGESKIREFSSPQRKLPSKIIVDYKKIDMMSLEVKLNEIYSAFTSIVEDTVFIASFNHDALSPEKMQYLKKQRMRSSS